MDRINLVYWDEKNYGDALSPYIINKLSGKTIQLKHAYINKYRKFVKSILFMSLNEIRSILFPWQNNVLGVGSIITCGNSKSIVWGAGFMNNSGEYFGREIRAVRGKLTSRKLVNSGHSKCEIYGDPALLLPLLISKPISIKNKLSIIPHWSETDEFIERFGDRYHIIDLRSKDVEKITKDIASSEYILSTSLHGIIVGQAYGIPSLWIKDGYIQTDGFKFADYFSSVDIPEYSGFQNLNQILESEESWRNFFQENKELCLIKKELNLIQQNLLKVAPFPIQNMYL